MNGRFARLARSRDPLPQCCRVVAGLWLVLLLNACATLTGEPPTVIAARGITVVPLADGDTRIDIATDVAFDFGSAVLRPAFAAQLAQSVQPYLQRPVRVSAYTDNVGAPAFNLELSQRRAGAVAEVLREQGISTAQLAVSGYGEDNPVASNASEAGRRQNRRIELLITAKVP
ncbi:MAG: OmpA family protein [Gammaproteobacteria bacterium]